LSTSIRCAKKKTEIYEYIDFIEMNSLPFGIFSLTRRSISYSEEIEGIEFCLTIPRNDGYLE
jgi:hypothetical protein